MRSEDAGSTATQVGAGLRAYLADLIQVLGPRRVLSAVALVLCGTLFESLGLLMLVPLLQLVNGTTRTPALQWLVDHGLQPSLGAVLSLFTLLMLLRAAAARQRELSLLKLRLDYVERLRRRLEQALAGASWTFLVRLRHGEVMHLLFEQLARINQGTHQLMQVLSGAGLGLASLLVAAFIAPLWTLALVAPFALLIWALRRRPGSAAAMGQRLGQGQRASMSVARDFLAGLKLVKAHAAESQHLAEFQRRAQTLRIEQLDFVHHQSVTRGWFEVVGALLLSALLYGAATWGGMGLPELLLIVLVFSRLLPVLRDGQLQVQQLAHMLPAFQELQGWIQRCEAHVEPAPDTALPPLPLQHSLTFEQVVVNHGGASPAALAGVNLVLPARETTALMGPSGSGKTTLADIALGLLPPSSGAVRVDGLSLADPQVQRRWRRSVAYVAQDTYLFPGTIRENLCWLSGQRPDADLWAALEQADATPFVQALAAGLDHRLGERGEGLSGGERQRIALARALLCQPELLVLDEVTSQLDLASEERVLAALDRLRGQVTILLIAHREAALRHADLVVVLEQGRVVEVSQGRPDAQAACQT